MTDRARVIAARSRLIDELAEWQDAQDLPRQCALEQLHEDITEEQRAWLLAFLERRDAANG